MQYIADNLDYDCSKIQEKSLRVICMFIVETDGSISRIKKYKTSGNRKLDRAAIKLIKKMPPWTPGKINGHSVRAKSACPISVGMVQRYSAQKESK
jgi:protein TonB